MRLWLAATPGLGLHVGAVCKGMGWVEAEGEMLNLQSGDRIELLYEDAPAPTIRATVGRLLNDRDEGMGIEVEDYIACWIEITVHEPRDMDPQTGCIARHGFPVSAERPPGNSP